MDWTHEFDAHYAQFRAIGERHFETMREAWETRRFPEEAWRDLAATELFTAMLPDSASSPVLYPAALAGMAAGAMDGGFTSALNAQWLALRTICELDDDATRAAYLQRFADAAVPLATALTEPSGGTDGFHPRTTLRRQGDDLLLTGRKWHITSVPVAGAIVVSASDDNGDTVLVVCEADAPGVVREAPCRTAGMRSAPMASVDFHDVVVAPTSVVPAPRARSVLKQLYIGERAYMSFTGIGGMERILEEVTDFAVSREVFGNPVIHNQHIQRRLVDMQMALETTRALAHTTLDRLLQGTCTSAQGSLLKLHASEACVTVTTQAMQLCASYGMQEDSRLPQLMLDAMCATVGAGTAEAHRLIIAKDLYDGHVRRGAATEDDAGPGVVMRVVEAAARAEPALVEVPAA